MSLAAELDATEEITVIKVRGAIAHAVAGRLRVRLLQPIEDIAYAQLEQQIMSLTCVESVRVNTTVGCLTITYEVSQFPGAAIPPVELLAAIAQVSSLQIDLDTNTSNSINFDRQPDPAQIQLRTFGAALVGGAVGDMFGGAVGATAGAIFMGPAGAILGGQIGVFVGSIIGAQIGAETVQQVDQFVWLADTQGTKLTAEQIAQTLQKRTSEKIGETTGQIFGAVAGKVVLGPTGAIFGSIVGGAIGAQLGEDTASSATLQKSPATTQQWLVNTTQKFVGETATATVGGAVGKIILGSPGQQMGLQLGKRISKIVDWNATTHQVVNITPTPQLSVENPQSDR
ncbi:hypothetical protein [Scytonema millei]|uniref:Glycine zipper domain-containing protein n=1 Tax=Scytonema millei VB511283 TaxID=1245923 RepID=A0A9X5E242_9CYAN|nr:hypothetical protein [Scytonema millei]NHC33423.1 hypothetical protein [Scytonema millei VB511283]